MFVPPCPFMPLMYDNAARTLPGVNGSGAGENCDTVLSKSMIWNQSPGLSPAMRRRIACLAFAMGSPDIEPEVSTTKTSSLGVTSFARVRGWGAMSIMR